MADGVDPNATRAVDSNKGLLMLDYSLKKVKSKYPLVALYTDTFPVEGHEALNIRAIPKKQIKYLLPSVRKDFSNDPRFYDCWSKLTPFSLVEYDRVVQLDSDMLALQNMDELMDLELDPPSMEGKGSRVFAASHACVCNPMKKPHYPKEWYEPNPEITTPFEPERAQKSGPSCTAGLGMPNGGLQVVNPSSAMYGLIANQLASSSGVESYEFADQSLLSDLFGGRWVAIPYVYNALKTMRWNDVHAAIWRDDQIKNVHLLLSPKPWDEKPGEESDETHKWWWNANRERLETEKQKGIDDGF
ncbi:MAG: hypothetical protein M1836_004467 [Candelina mexicana]|nr:MAG: hypothetical protein M1836_004467 [Candelina mexicana]